MSNYNWPLMFNNITKEDRVKLSKFVLNSSKLTQGKTVQKFEEEWSKWLGIKYSIFVNSGSSANLLSIHVLKLINNNPKKNEIIIPSFTWSSDVSSVILCGLKPVFVDVCLENMALDLDKVKKSISSNTLAIFLTHAQGFNGLSEDLINLCKIKKIHLLEDCCESHGALHRGKKIGNFSLMSNFSFYYAHHMTTIEGGMISTNDKKIYQILRMIRSHGLARESNDRNTINQIYKRNPSLNKEFIFEYIGYNVRNNEISAKLGLIQLKKLDKNIRLRNRNKNYFLENINKNIFFTNFLTEGMSNYALNLVLIKKNKKLFNKVCKIIKNSGVEIRVGSAGGGNQLRQPYIKNLHNYKLTDFPVSEHIHFYSLYIGNFPELSLSKIKSLCYKLNSI